MRLEAQGIDELPLPRRRGQIIHTGAKMHMDMDHVGRASSFADIMVSLPVWGRHSIPICGVQNYVRFHVTGVRRTRVELLLMWHLDTLMVEN